MTLVRDATGLDINMHFTCRDRNLMGIQADLLGAHAMDIRNILAMTGDPPRTGDYVNATAVFDVDAIGLIRILAEMNRGARRHRHLDRRADLVQRGGGASTRPARSRRARWSASSPRSRRARAGCRRSPSTIWTCSTGSSRALRPPRFLSVVGIMPLHSSRHAEFLHNEVPGITVPDAVRARMREAGDRGLRAGIEMAQRLLRDVRTHHDAGVYLMPSFGRFEVVAEVLDALH